MTTVNYTIPVGSKLSETHEFVYLLDDSNERARIGISHHAAELLGDIVFVELPELGDTLEKGDTFGSIESVKAASDLYMPVSGEIVALNTQLEEDPGVINSDCYQDGWIIEVSLGKPEELDSLMDSEQYLKFVDESSASS